MSISNIIHSLVARIHVAFSYMLGDICAYMAIYIYIIIFMSSYIVTIKLQIDCYNITIVWLSHMHLVTFVHLWLYKYGCLYVCYNIHEYI